MRPTLSETVALTGASPAYVEGAPDEATAADMAISWIYLALAVALVVVVGGSWLAYLLT
jgi:hypothetical protein